jgi:hypothetical protein
VTRSEQPDRIGEGEPFVVFCRERAVELHALRPDQLARLQAELDSPAWTEDTPDGIAYLLTTVQRIMQRRAQILARRAERTGAPRCSP